MSDKKEETLAISDFNLQVINTEQYSIALQSAIQSGSNLAVFGRRGSGKTEIAKQSIATTEVNVPLNAGVKAKEIYINLSVAERTDMGGYPDMFGMMQKPSSDDKKARFVQFILPMFYQAMIEGDHPVVAIFDEVDKADSSLHGPLLEIWQQRSINHRPLPNLKCCIATGNLVSEGSTRPSLPLLDRAEKYLLSADTDSFLKWAASSNRIHPSIRAFLRDKPSFLYGSNDGAGDLYAEPSPRSWENFSKSLYFGEANGWKEDIINLKVAGFVGKQAGLEYNMYYTHYQKLLPLVDKIFEGKDCVSDYKVEDPSMQIYACMIACSRLAGILDRVPLDNERKPTFVPPEVGCLGRFLSKAASDEDILISVRTQFTLARMVTWELDSNKDWSKILHTVTDNADNA